jgi:hypothetical protein
MTSPARAKKRRKYREKVKGYTKDLLEINSAIDRQERRSLAWEMVDFKEIK